jgi:hypothetical protein
VRERFSVVMARMVNERRGTPCIGLEHVTPDRKSIMASRSFGRPVTMPDEMAEAVATYTARGREDAPAAPRHGQPDRVRRNQPLSPRRSTAFREQGCAASRCHGPHRQADLGGAARPCYNRPRTLLFSTLLVVWSRNIVGTLLGWPWYSMPTGLSA